MNELAKKTTSFLFWVAFNHIQLLGAPVPSRREINSRTSQVQRLDPNCVASTAPCPWRPSEVVAIAGNISQRHWHPIMGVVFSPDGKRIASIAHDGVRILEAHNYRCSMLLPLQAILVRFVSRDIVLLACSDDATVQLWDISGPRAKRKMLMHGNKGAFRFFDTTATVNGGIVISRTSSTVALYQLNILSLTQAILPLEETQTFVTAAFSTDSHTLATLICKMEYFGKWGEYSRRFDHQVILWEVNGVQVKSLSG